MENQTVSDDEEYDVASVKNCIKIHVICRHKFLQGWFKGKNKAENNNHTPSHRYDFDHTLVGDINRVLYVEQNFKQSVQGNIEHRKQ